MECFLLRDTIKNKMNCCQNLLLSYRRAVKQNRTHPLTLEIRDPAIRKEFNKKLEERALRWIPIILILTLLKFFFALVSILTGS